MVFLSSLKYLHVKISVSMKTIWRKDFQNSVEKAARAKGNYQHIERAKNAQRSRSLFRRFKEEGKGYSPDIFRTQREPTQLTQSQVRCMALSSSALLAAIEEGEIMKNGSFQSLFNSSEAKATRNKRRPLETTVVTKETINSEQFSRPAA